MDKGSQAGLNNFGGALSVVGFSLFFLILFVPTSYRTVKSVLLGALLVGILVGAFHRARFRLSPQILNLFLFYSLLGLFFVLYGLINGNPGALPLLTVHVLWPLVYMIIISAMLSEAIFRIAMQVLIFSAAAISLYALYYLLYEYGVIPSVLYLELELGQAAGFYDGYIEYNLFSISTLIYLFPFVTACLVLWKGKGHDSPVSQKWLLAIFVLTAIASILSGRRALWLSMALTPILIWAFSLPGKREGRRQGRRRATAALYLSLGLTTLFFVLSMVFDVNIASIAENFLAGFRFDETASASERKVQFFALIDGWITSPLLGAGLGAVAEGSIRSEEMPWAYELYILSLLFQTGLVGIFLYAYGIGWIFVQGTQIIRHDVSLRAYMIPVLVGLTSFLIANNTNPYLGKFDSLWVIFLPVAMINFYLLKQSSAQSLVSSHD